MGSKGILPQDNPKIKPKALCFLNNFQKGKMVFPLFYSILGDVEVG